MKTYMASAETVERNWYIVDASGKIFGRIASQVATVLCGKNKPTYTPHVDTGDYVIIINADKAVLTGKKLDQKIYHHHSGYIGGMKEIKYRDMMRDKPEFALKEAIRRMLPKSSLGDAMLKKVRIYRGTEHGHEAQKPVFMEIQ